MKFHLVFVISVVLTLCGSLSAQLPTADLTRMVPRAAGPGETVEVNLVGSNLDQLTALHFSHPGISAVPATLPDSEFFPTARQNGTRFNVTVAADVPPGIYEARAAGYFGLSTARPFVVSRPDLQQIVCDGRNTSLQSALEITADSVVTGDIPARGVHWFQVNVEPGQRLLIETIAERIDSRLDSQIIIHDSDGRELDRNRDHYGRDSFLEFSPDEKCVCFIAVSDILFRGGGEYFYRLKVSTQPHVDFVDPPAGEPGTTRKFTLYGRNLPGGRQTSMAVNGHTLEALDVDIDVPDSNGATAAGFYAGTPRQGLLPGFFYQFPRANPIRIGFATAPVIEEAPETGESASESVGVRTVTAPAEIAGRFGRANEEDRFRFSAKAGETWYVESTADRMSSPVDTLLIVQKIKVSSEGLETASSVAENDDPPSFFSQHGKDAINPDTNDAVVSFTADEDAEYQVTIVNQFGDGSPRHQYRLAIRRQTPDFQLLATTERPLPTGRTGYSVTPHLRKGASWGIRILCPRQDRFAEDIVVTAEDLPAGVTARPLTLSGQTDRGILILTASKDAEAWSGHIRVVGRARINDEEVSREARFACLVWGHIFADSIRVRSRLAERIPLSVNGYEAAPIKLDIDFSKTLTVRIGEKLEIPVRVAQADTRVGNVTVEVQEFFGLHRGHPNVNIAQDQSEATLGFSFVPNGNFNPQPGRYQFALQGTGVTKYRRNERAIAIATAEKDRLDQRAKEIAAVATTAGDSLMKAEAALRESQETKEQTRLLQKDVEEKRRLATEAENRLKRIQTEAANAQKTVDAATSQAKESNTKFSVWSELLTVDVLEKAK